MKKLIFILIPILFFVCADAHLPRILIIGDSISLGYTPIVQELMKIRNNLR